MGGAEVFTREVAKRWVEDGNEITLFTAEFPGCKKEEIADGVHIIRAGGRFSVYHNARKFYKKRFNTEDFDVIIDEINTVPFFVPKFVRNEKKVVVLIHQLAREFWFYEMPFPLSHIGYYFLEEKWLRQYINLPTVTVSESSRADLAKLGFKNIFVVPEGLNFKPLMSLPDKGYKPVIVYAGRFKRAKRPDHAIKAFRLVKDKIPDAELWLLGDGPFKNDLECIAGEGVRFFSGLSNDDRRLLIKRSWVLVNPGVREGWGLNIIEANAMGVPAVAYNVPGLRDSVKDGKTGLLSKAGDIQDLADKILMLLNNHAQREQFSKNALDFSKEFNWDTTASEFFKVLKLWPLTNH